MDFQSMMETFAEAWVAANTQTPLTEAAAAAAAADHQNLLLGLGGSAPGGPTLDMASSEQMARRLGTSPSATQSPGLNLSAQHTDPDTESLSPAFVASSLLEMKDVISGNNGRNIPLHCIIERANPSLVSPGTSSTSPSGGSQPSSSQAATPPATSSTPGDLSLTPGGSSSTPTSGPGSCQAGGPGNPNNPGNLVVEADTYAILPSSIPFADIVRSSLTKLGYAPQEMVGAKGLVQLRNWKPLSLDQISESVEATIGDILGDISSFITLRIRLFRPRMSAAHELKDKLLQVLIAHSYSLLTNSGSSIDQQILSSLIRGGRNDQIELNNDDARRRFDQWYLQQVFNQYRQLALAAQQPPVPVPALRPNGSSSAGAPPTHPLFMDLNLNGSEPSLAGLHPSLAAAAAAAAAATVRPTTNGNLGSGNGSNSTEKMYGGLKQSNSGNGHGCHQNTSSSHHSSSITSSRTRIRTSFDPELELPKLHKWFQENRHPSRSQVQEYVKELNSLESRKGRKPLDVNNVVYWFKNARAAHKRAELKFISGDSSNMGNHQFGGFGQGNNLGPSGGGDYFINGGNHSPGKASSEASKCNDEPMSNASRNGSNLDDYYSFDEDGDSHEETQTLDLSVRPHGHNCPRKNRSLSESPIIKLEESDEMDDMKPGHESEFRSDICSGLDQETGSNADSGKMEHSGRNTDCGASSDCNSIEEDSEEETETSGSLGAGSQYNNIAAASGLARNLSNLMGMGNGSGSTNSTHNPESPEGRRARRSRTFIDPMSEVPRLESWFMSNTHPAHSQIVRYTDELNKMPYRQKFPKLEPKNIQFWFKNRRAKIKRTSGLNPSALMAAAAVAGTPASSGAGTLPSTSLHNSSALNIERLINAH